MTDQPLILGLDGGGTKTVAWLAVSSGPSTRHVVGRGRSGPANPRAVGFEQAMANLDEAVELSFQDAAIARQPVASACLALAGADRPVERELLSRWARGRHLADKLRLANDAEPILACGAPEGWGVALIAGTGSFAFGRNPRGDTVRVGGWGYLFGDEGSGYALAVAGLRAAARCADGRGPHTELLARLQQALKVDRPMGLIEAVYRSGADRRTIADLAPAVLTAARDGDAVASGLVDTAAADLAELVDTLRRRLQLQTTRLPLALSGSLLLRGELLKERMLNRLERIGCQGAVVTEVDDPVRGAVLLAHQELR